MFSPSDITVYVPYFNAGRTISRCIDSLKNQSITPFEIIIVNDGSEEPLPETIDCRVIEHAANKGLSAGRNTALGACKTKLIASVDADVVADTHWLENLLKKINETDAAGVGGRMLEYYQENPGDRWRAVHMAQHWGEEVLKNPKFLFGANTLFKVVALKAVGGYNEVLRTNNEDRTISELIYESGKDLIYEPAARCSHLRRDKTETILSAYWGWHHAKGLLEGDFDSLDSLISRIGRVNFGISNYRYNLDKEAGRNDFLILDLLIPYVFCCRDLIFYCNRKGKKIPDLALLAKTVSSEKFEDLLEFIPSFKNSNSVDSCFESYLEIFRRQLKEFMTVEKLKGLDFTSWLRDNKSRVFEKR